MIASELVYDVASISRPVTRLEKSWVGVVNCCYTLVFQGGDPCGIVKVAKSWAGMLWRLGGRQSTTLRVWEGSSIGCSSFQTLLNDS